MSVRRLTAAAVVLGAVALPVQSQEPIPQGGAPCLSCHSVDGRPLLADVPVIAGQQVQYLIRALTSYRDGTRTGGQALVMQQFAKDLDDGQIALLARWFGAAR